MAAVLQEAPIFMQASSINIPAGKGALCPLSSRPAQSCRVFRLSCQWPSSACFSSSRGTTYLTRAVGDNNEGVGSPTVLPSGEWPENFSILNFEDLSKHYESVLFKEEAQPSTFLADVMSTTIYTARPDQRLEEIDRYFILVSGLPVINENYECIGVLSKKDKSKATNGLNSKVQEVMSSPPITLTAEKTVSDAAILMLKHKIHRIPVVNNSRQVVGMVTRTDIFSALEGKPSS
ncbi:hypothetical protein L7F22_033505 [Adiantum nelumboides]|nr:hypothetical protein [Adiantum nelumboides]